MITYLAIKYLHVITAILTISGFVLRGIWMMAGSSKLDLPITRVAPHVVDTIFLLSGVAMLVLLSINPFAHVWLVAKFAGIAAYIVLGSVAIRFGRTREERLVAFAAALSVYAWVVGVALSKSPASWLAWLT